MKHVVKVEVGPAGAFLTVLALGLHPCLSSAFSTGYAGGVISNWAAFSSQTPEVLEVPLTTWRHLLRGVDQVFPVFSAHAVERGELAEPQTLAYEVNGVEYSRVDDIPEFPLFIADLGALNLPETEVLAIDPGYADGEEQAVKLLVLPGTWRAQVRMVDGRHGFAPAQLSIEHSAEQGFDTFHPDSYPITNPRLVDVDRGMAGFFLASAYPTDEFSHEPEDGTFYWLALAAQETDADYHPDGRKIPAAVLAHTTGVVSHAFEGDGIYACLSRKNAEGLVVAALLNFHPADSLFPTYEE